MHFFHSQIHNNNGAITNPSIISPPYSSIPYNSEPTQISSSSGNKISPAILFIIVILAIIFFILGFLHLLVRFLIKHRSSSSSSTTTISQSNRFPEMSESDAYQRQLQQLFNLHDSGLDQAFIDALPVFIYKEIIGLKEPFDCAVCLCEFLEQDKLRLLPNCNHAFHISCIDTWLLSNSSCPLCRNTLYSQGFSFDKNPIFEFEDERDEEFVIGIGSVNKDMENHIMNGKRVFSVRLGKFRSSNNEEGGAKSEGESSNCNFDVRRCYSMGSFQYVVADSDLQVALKASKGDGSMRQLKGIREIQDGSFSNDGDVEGKKINIARKGESFSVSKIWQWSKKDSKIPSSSDTHFHNCVANESLQWMNKARGT
ncbi:putative transcription factor C2H2 family [Medicago truncatula]|uniref:RING-type E3 ubiquitin transferase n=1 Tax=Medicago truncatula TaxID=3880 RepID=G7K1H8_MEDTR|nr:RING-H2 finger protein ATL47 [Medicago truncatula]AES96231.1 RING-H2 finger protein ATL47 [Medicago truncatula]RHN55082.1 putative transcription factor C2H2 family [Medicago truncatula]